MGLSLSGYGVLNSYGEIVTVVAPTSTPGSQLLYRYLVRKFARHSRLLFYTARRLLSL